MKPTASFTESEVEAAALAKLDLLASRSAAVELFRPLAAFTPYAVQFRYEGLGPGHEAVDRSAALTRVEELARHVRDRLAEVR